MFYVQKSNQHAYCISVAFIALRKIKRNADDREHVDFGDNKFPLYLPNRRNQIYCEDDEDCDIEVDRGSFLNEEQIDSISKYVPKSILTFLTVHDDV